MKPITQSTFWKACPEKVAVPRATYFLLLLACWLSILEKLK